MTTEAPPHHCPGCGAEQRAFPRYPWYFCQLCLKQARDANGRGLTFHNAGVSGGLEWSFDDEDLIYDAQPVVCLIKGRPALVQEARFGGIVAEPLTSRSLGVRPYRMVDVRDGIKSDHPLTPRRRADAPGVMDVSRKRMGKIRKTDPGDEPA